MHPQTTNKTTQTRDVYRFGFESAGALEFDNEYSGFAIVSAHWSRRRPAGPGWVSRAKRAVPEGSCAYYYAVECRRWSECGFGAAEEALAECRSTCSRLPPFGSICPGTDSIRAMQEQLPPGMEVRGVSICPGTDGIRAMQEQLPRTRKLCRGKRDSLFAVECNRLPPFGSSEATLLTKALTYPV